MEDMTLKNQLRSLAVLLMMVLFSPLAAQQLEVVSFEEALQDNSAWNSQTRRELPDGRFCPIIKVELNEKELAFEGNLIGEQLFKTNEYWVYMNVGAYHLVIKHPDYEKLDVLFAEVNPNIKRLQEKRTYILKLKGNAKKGLESIEQGEASAMLKQAQNYEQGTGAYNKDLTQALVWYEKAAEAGSVEAQEYLAEVLYKGTNGYTRNPEKSLRWNEVCAQRGKASCYLPLAELYTNLKQNDHVVKWLRKHCETKRGDIPQKVRLGKLIGVDKPEGFKWLQEASEVGNKEATSLCLAYLKKTSPKDAVPFYLRAIDGGDMVAASEYAQILLEGKYGIPKDEAEGKRLLELAASSVFNTYASYKSDDPEFQSYISNIPKLLSRVKNRDIKAMISLILIYRALGDKDMTERMLTLARYNLSNGMRLPATFDFYLEQKANYQEQNYEKLLYDGLDFRVVDRENYFKLVKAVIDDVVLAQKPVFTAINHITPKNSFDTPKDEATRLMVRWAKDFYEQDCLDKLCSPLVLSQLNVKIYYKDNRQNNFRNFHITYYDGTMAGTSEYAHKVILAMYQLAQQEWKLGSYPYYDNYIWAFKQLERYAKQAEKKTPSFKSRIPYSSWIKKMKEEGYFWNLEIGKGSKGDVVSERGKLYNAIMFEVNGVKFNMIRIKADIQYARQLDHRKVLLKSYLIGETEVTNALWKAVMGKAKSSGSPEQPALACWSEWQSFFQKLRVMQKYRFRSPSQEEWIYAAQGGEKSHGYRYSGSNNIDEVAWYDKNAQGIQEVAKKKPNELGLYDMSGNALEWTDNSLSPVNCAGGGFHPVDPRWATAERCVVNPYNNNSHCKPERELGMRLVLSVNANK